MLTIALDELAHLVTSRGVHGAERELAEFARWLMAAGIAPRCTSIIVDRAAPAIVRERAFARAAIEVHKASIAQTDAA